jgi:hypothetical protein
MAEQPSDPNERGLVLPKKAVVMLLLMGPIAGTIFLTPAGAVQSRVASSDSATSTDSFADSVAISGSAIAVGDSDHHGTGYAYVFTQSGTRWEFGGRVAGRKGFGSSVAVSGSNLAVGTTYGRAYVYVSDGGAWRRTADLKSPNGNSSYFGDEVALSGATLMAGSISDDSNAGRVFVFTNRVAGWKQTAELAAKSIGAGSLFGTQVVSSGTDLVGTTAQGQVFIFTDGPKGWGQPTELGGPGTNQGDGGGAVAISGNTIVIGDPGYDKGKGVVYVYTNTGSQWRESAQLANRHSKTGDGFGYSVGISGTNVVVGADYAEGYRGAAYVFTASAGRWKQVAELDPSGTIPNSNFGSDVAISGTTIVVGTNGDTGCDELSINGGPSQAVDCAPRASWGAYVYSDTAAGWREVTDLHPPSK